MLTEQTSIRFTPEEKLQVQVLAHLGACSQNSAIRAAVASLVDRAKTSPHTVKAVISGYLLGTPSQDR